MFPNSNYTDVLATTIEQRSPEIADNVSKSTALLFRLQEKGKIKPFSGGSKIVVPLSFAENGNFSWYSGYDSIGITAQDVISAAEYPIRQCAVGVPISGLEELQNSGEEGLIDLLDGRMEVAEQTMTNKMSESLYSDGTNYGGKQIGGLLAAVPVDPTTGVYGGIDRSTTIGTFWRSVVGGNSSYTSTNILSYMNALWVQLVRGNEHPDLIPADNLFYQTYLSALQPNQRFTDPKLADAGFTSVKYMNADVVLDGGIGGYAPANSAWFLNTKYIYLRPHKDRNMRALSPNGRSAVNQDAKVNLLAWAGNLVLSFAKCHGFFKGY